MKLIGPFTQVLTLHQLPLKGSLKDDQLEIIPDGGVLVRGGEIQSVGNWKALRRQYPEAKMEEVDGPSVAMPGLIDAHTHICFAGSRAMDYAARNDGKSYLDIQQAGGGIWSTVQHTREASLDELTRLTTQRIQRLNEHGITTVEVKSGYGLNVEEELKMLRCINTVKEANTANIDLISTCLAAHIKPKDFEGTHATYLQYLVEELVPHVQAEKLTTRFDIFVEEGAFDPMISKVYLEQIKLLGFDLTIHGDQFSTGGSRLAVEVGARSVDHLEASGAQEIEFLSKSDVVPVALPGASLGLGCAFAPARKLLDAGCSLAIASDWNPGSAPHGELLTQAALLGAHQKLSSAEVIAALTFRAAHALGLGDRGSLSAGKLADVVSFPCTDYREVLYHQGSLKVSQVWKRGGLLSPTSKS
ncbi:imidazolonepropionase [Reichenbachiella sp. 5M10]|uniref:imidazolonepropionase n=1 Tax=Reichenbachiella sp. 5M10 TaxID=1889772 RepID=UPI000C15EAD6|nr:imidazolonepropionase [Reichenbachiella sp. 5M10]PIB37430.1 imidazolonepropionase [Reichenbachiella sp. 5M10]